MNFANSLRALVFTETPPVAASEALLRLIKNTQTTQVLT